MIAFYFYLSKRYYLHIQPHPQLPGVKASPFGFGKGRNPESNRMDPQLSPSQLHGSSPLLSTFVPVLPSSRGC